MTLRELFDTLAAHAGGDDGLSPELQAEIESAIRIFDDMWYVVSDHCENILGQWFVHQHEEDRLLQFEEAAFVGGAKLAGAKIELPEGYVEQGKQLND